MIPKTEQELKKLDNETQVNLLSVATQFLESLIDDPQDAINPLDVFVLRCNSIVGDSHKPLNTIGLAIGAVVIALAVVASTMALGIGIGMVINLWETPLLFMAALMAAESAPLLVASTSGIAGIGAGLISHYLFFKEPKIKTALNQCVEAVKQSNLTQELIAENDEDFNEEARPTEEANLIIRTN